MTDEIELCWSDNGEDYSFQTLGDLLDCHDHEVGDVVYVGESHRPAASEFVSTDDVIDAVRDRASEEHGHWAEDFADVSAEAEQELQALLEAWAEKHLCVTFWHVKNTRKHTITAEDLAP